MHTAYIGRDRETGDRVFLHLELRELIGPRETTAHDTVTSLTELTISGTEVQKGTTRTLAVGQISMHRRPESIRPAEGWTERDIASAWAIWDAWHLGSMSAACDHMDLTGLGTSYDERRHVVCPLTGARYGSAWWARPLPPDVETQARRLMSLPAGNVPAYVY
jgi:hypothetical protein